MKKSILAIALMAMVSFTASAASIIWSSSALSFNGVDLKKDSNVTGYLIYLADGAFASSYTIDEAFSVASIGTLIQENTDSTSKGSKSFKTYDFLFSDETGVYGNGDRIAMLVSYANPNEDGTVYWNLSSAIQTISGVQEDGDAFKGADFAFNNARGTDPTLIAGGGWVKAVPEPATGALALAGLALLFRRKRA